MSINEARSATLRVQRSSLAISTAPTWRPWDGAHDPLPPWPVQRLRGGASADLAGLDLSVATLAGANLALADLSGANLNSVNLTGATLAGAVLTGADLTDALLPGGHAGRVPHRGHPTALPTGAVPMTADRWHRAEQLPLAALQEGDLTNAERCARQGIARRG